MQDMEKAVTAHYGGEGLLQRILAALEAGGVDLEKLTIDDIAPVDEFHIGGRAATRYAVAAMGLNAGQHVLDIGCGIGGAARYLATGTGCQVSAIDLTPAYIETAKGLTGYCGLSDKIDFKVASALDLPFADAAFDAGITIHAAMNISDRAGLYAETARVLRPGAVFCSYDVMRMSDEPLSFPLPWASGQATSHLTSPDEMRELLTAAGFEIEQMEDRTEMAIEFFTKRLAPSDSPPPALGINLILGDSAREKFTNTLENIKAGRIGPVQIIARRKG